MASDVLFSIVTPSAGRRPRALARAAESVGTAAMHALAVCGLNPARIEMLLGFDAIDAPRPDCGPVPLRSWVLPRPQGATCGFGNHIRDVLIRAAKGSHLIFLDDDNELTPEALALYLPHLAAEFILARVDTSRAFDVPFLPRPAPPDADAAQDAIRQGNIDPLCLCLSRELVGVRCGGWRDEGGYESDYLNIRRYFRRARGIVRLDGLVGVYDAGRGLDPEGQNPRQRRLAAQG